MYSPTSSSSQVTESFSNETSVCVPVEIVPEADSDAPSKLTVMVTELPLFV